MRIVSGKFKGKKLEDISKDSIIRPTTDRAKETMFNTLNSLNVEAIVNKNVIDIFSGSGALGIEALSRGANFVTFVEKDKDSVAIIKKNLANLKGATNYNIISKDIFKLTNNDFTLAYSLVFMDPPYKEKLANKTLEKLINLDVLIKSKTIIVCETSLPEEISLTSIKLIKEKNISKSKLSFLEY